MVSTEFLVTSLIVVLIPGTGVIYTISTGLFQDWYASILAAIGCTTGIIPHLVASTMGLATILHMSAVAFQVIKFIGVAYLLYLAWSMWRESGLVKIQEERSTRGGWSICIKGFLINILNPKLSMFFLAFLPQFVPSNSETPILNMILLSGIFMGMTLFVFVLYGLFASRVKDYVVNSPGKIAVTQRTFAITFALLAAKLAISDR